ncbi:MAG: AmmeMemoRadiSam system protein B [Candidatus Omnitrophica bacterium]|nr:AmmeMemoRadiSam system protein B [Candidatus Omnitrophota bacterium]
MLIRKPVVAGSFYPSDALSIQEFCEPYLKSSEEVIPARAVILPHAGYVYSGKTACLTLARVNIPERVVLMGPNHHGVGADFALYARGEWESPLGTVPIASDLSTEILKVDSIQEDPEAHASEHSLEVLVPMLQIKNPKVQIAPLTVGAHDFSEIREVARELGEVLMQSGVNFMMVVSNDMSHFDRDQSTRKKDAYALRAIGNLDAEGLVKAVKQYHISMCGIVPVYMLLVMSPVLGIKRATLVDYRTSADATGDDERVVGYAGFVFES